jgi:predicted RNase H-like nuclease
MTTTSTQGGTVAAAGRVVGGADVCRAGWALAVLDVDAEPGSPEARPSLHLVEDFQEVVDDVRSGTLAAVGVDIPIGLADASRRRCDTEARQLVGKRRSSVFSAPIRPLLGAPTFEEANERSRAILDRGLSLQSFGLLKRIAEVDRLMTAELQGWIREVHPEVVFARLKGSDLDHPKRRTAGRQERLDLLRPHVGDASTLSRASGIAGDDALDAIACALAARALVVGDVTVLGDGARDVRGLAMEMVTL